MPGTLPMEPSLWLLKSLSLNELKGLACIMATLTVLWETAKKIVVSESKKLSPKARTRILSVDTEMRQIRKRCGG